MIQVVEDLIDSGLRKVLQVSFRNMSSGSSGSAGTSGSGSQYVNRLGPLDYHCPEANFTFPSTPHKYPVKSP